MELKCLVGPHGNSGSLRTHNLGIVGFGCCCSGLGLKEKSQSLEKVRELKTEQVNTAKSSREQVPTDLLALSLEGVALQLGPSTAGMKRSPTSEGKGASLLTIPGRSSSQ